MQTLSEDDQSQIGGEQSRQVKGSSFSTLPVSMTSHQRTMERIHQMLQSLQREQCQEERSVSNMQSQNKQAAEIMQSISSQLKSKSQKYKALKQHVTRLAGVFDNAKTKVKALREQSNTMRRAYAPHFQLTIAELEAILDDALTLAEQTSLSSSRSISSLFSDGSTAPLRRRDNLDGEEEPDILRLFGGKALFQEAAKSAKWTFETKLATYEVRKPFNTGDRADASSLSWTLKMRTPLAEYSSSLALFNPSSFEIAAKIKTQESEGILILSGQNNVQYRSNTAAKWMDFGNVDFYDSPIGWELDCSLDQVLEEAHFYRQKCCHALSLRLRKSDCSKLGQILRNKVVMAIVVALVSFGVATIHHSAILSSP